jgi:hypothetical protein
MIELDQAVSADLGGCVCAACQRDRKSARQERAFGDPDPVPIAGSKVAHALVVPEQPRSSNQAYHVAFAPTANCQPPAANCQPPTANRQPPTARLLPNLEKLRDAIIKELGR